MRILSKQHQGPKHTQDLSPQVSDPHPTTWAQDMGQSGPDGGRQAQVDQYLENFTDQEIHGHTTLDNDPENEDNDPGYEFTQPKIVERLKKMKTRRAVPYRRQPKECLQILLDQDTPLAQWIAILLNRAYILQKIPIDGNSAKAHPLIRIMVKKYQGS